ncbi:MAG: valine--tRNA ligase, partial [Anaerolineae bacterium]|nr:valine--tRNA ligase [Anaerolineae bacterium]
ILISPGEQHAVLQEYSYLFTRLANVSEAKMLDANTTAPEKAATVVASDVTVYIPLVDLLDIDAERERLAKEREKLQEMLNRSQSMLQNEQFVQRARPDVVERERTKLSDLQASLAQVSERLVTLQTKD